MVDMENVIKGLNDIGGFIAGRLEFEHARNFLRTIDDAIELLKKQEAVEPIREDDGYYRCRSCNAYVAFPNGDCKKSFCEKCGQAVKWDA